MNPWIDVGLIVGCVAAVAAAWPFLRDFAAALQDAEDEYIARQLEEQRAWDDSREDRDIHKGL